MNKFFGSVIAVMMAASLCACGGGGGGPAPVAVAAADTTVAVSPTTTAVVTGIPFTFTAVPSFGTTGTTTLTFTNTSTTPAFSVISGSNTASGTTTFGSCDFHITSSTFTPPSPMVVGNTVIVDPCTMKINTNGAVTGSPSDRTITITLGASQSGGVTKTVVVTPDGSVTIDGHTVSTVPVKVVSGAG